MIQKNENTSEKEIILAEASIRLRKDGILHITYNKGTVLDVELQERMVHLFAQITDGAKVPMLFDAFDGVSVTPEARANATRLEPVSPSIAYAVVANSLAYRLIANFYMKVNKPKLPYRIFSDKEKAIEWLKTFT